MKRSTVHRDFIKVMQPWLAEPGLDILRSMPHLISTSMSPHPVPTACLMTSRSCSGQRGGGGCEERVWCNVYMEAGARAGLSGLGPA